MSPRGSRLCSGSMVSSVLGFMGNAQANVTMTRVQEDCCNKCILQCQTDFHAQKSIVQEVIEAAGHLCIVLPKFYCELNFIKNFWGVVKKYLRNNCNYTFSMLKENTPKASAMVKLSTICLWEHLMYGWMEAYRLGLDTTVA